MPASVAEESGGFLQESRAQEAGMIQQRANEFRSVNLGSRLTRLSAGDDASDRGGW
jgi:hypothetical protein